MRRGWPQILPHCSQRRRGAQRLFRRLGGGDGTRRWDVSGTARVQLHAHAVSACTTDCMHVSLARKRQEKRRTVILAHVRRRNKRDFSLEFGLEHTHPPTLAHNTPDAFCRLRSSGGTVAAPDNDALYGSTSCSSSLPVSEPLEYSASAPAAAVVVSAWLSSNSSMNSRRYLRGMPMVSTGCVREFTTLKSEPPNLSQRQQDAQPGAGRARRETCSLSKAARKVSSQCIATPYFFLSRATASRSLALVSEPLRFRILQNLIAWPLTRSHSWRTPYDSISWRSCKGGK